MSVNVYKYESDTQECITLYQEFLRNQCMKQIRKMKLFKIPLRELELCLSRQMIVEQTYPVDNVKEILPLLLPGQTDKFEQEIQMHIDRTEK